MFATMPHKKMEKVNRFGFIAKCDCGHVHRFKNNEINSGKSNGATILFKNIYSCPKCGQTYDGIFQNIVDRNVWYRNNPIGVLVTIIFALALIIGGYHILNSIFSPSQPAGIEHATNKQLNNFYKWDHEQQQQKQDNSPAFNNK